MKLKFQAVLIFILKYCKGVFVWHNIYIYVISVSSNSSSDIYFIVSIQCSWGHRVCIMRVFGVPPAAAAAAAAAASSQTWTTIPGWLSEGGWSSWIPPEKINKMICKFKNFQIHFLNFYKIYFIKKYLFFWKFIP